jgi:hypothetical protein
VIGGVLVATRGGGQEAQELVHIEV